MIGPPASARQVVPASAHEAVRGQDGHDGWTYPLTAAEELTPSEKVTAIGEALGRALAFEELDGPRTLKLIAEQAPDDTAKALMVPGVCGLESPGVLGTVEAVTGIPARKLPAVGTRQHRGLLRRER
jgi:uncharacterized protein YbjT (DUF2867 family)